MNKTLKNILLIPFNILYKINPKFELSLMFRLQNGYKMRWDNPVTYNEKLQWIKLYDRNELMPRCTDKYKVREYVEDCGCKEILNELFWEGFNATEIPFDELPDQFVIKVTHGSGANIICKNKDDINRLEIIKQLNKWLKSKYIPCYGEWFYDIIKPRIIVEKLLTDSKSFAPIDYKVFCFNGEPKLIDVHTERFVDHKRNLYDLEWNVLKGRSIAFKNDDSKAIEKPEQLEQLLEYARILSKPFIHARVDFYIVDKKIYFGELTFLNGAGFDKITPYSFNVQMGNWCELPKSRSR